ncbi:MAG: ubiquinone/menaquinone biosynthesis methyltransferase [Verrucomicrobiae bacterium]|nr:ubiquinone/menaquinone biosynthesis methyltransferase [Verrucomicrobiae bacterium]
MKRYPTHGPERAAAVRRLFSGLARRYDLVNDVQSAGLHRLWKRRLLRGMELRPEQRLLDLACGTGDLAWRAASRTRVVGGDFSTPMLVRARARRTSGAAPSWTLLDGLALPFHSGSFDAAVVAYGLRNFADPPAALRELFRVLRSGGRLGILDFGKPPQRFVRAAYDRWLRMAPPLLGFWFFRDAEAYAYIAESLAAYPEADGVSAWLRAAGFGGVRFERLCLGAMTLHRASKP